VSECTHNCSSCSSKDCKERTDFREKQNERSNIKKVIGVVSGKGGVGKSMVTSMLAVLTNRKGLKTTAIHPKYQEVIHNIKIIIVFPQITI